MDKECCPVHVHAMTSPHPDAALGFRCLAHAQVHRAGEQRGICLYISHGTSSAWAHWNRVMLILKQEQAAQHRAGCMAVARGWCSWKCDWRLRRDLLESMTVVLLRHHRGLYLRLRAAWMRWRTSAADMIELAAVMLIRHEREVYLQMCSAWGSWRSSVSLLASNMSLSVTPSQQKIAKSWKLWRISIPDPLSSSLTVCYLGLLVAC